MPHQPIKNKQEWITFISTPPPKTLADLLPLRTECYREIEKLRERKLLVYASNFLNNANNGANVSIDLTDVEGFTDLVNSIKGGDSIDVLIHSPGGYPDATERIVGILRNRFKEVHFLIPHSAYSAATMLALSGNTITLHSSATLGPIDPQINGSPARSIKRGFENVKEKVKKDGPESLPAYIPLIEKYTIDLLEQCEDALNLSKQLVITWLKEYMLHDGKDHDEQITNAVQYFSDYDEHLTHSRPLVFSKLEKFGLNISVADAQLSELLWETHILLDGFFAASNFAKLFENAHGISWGRQGQMFQFMPQIPPQGAQPKQMQALQAKNKLFSFLMSEIPENTNKEGATKPIELTTTEEAAIQNHGLQLEDHTQQLQNHWSEIQNNRTENRNILIGVVLAFLFVVVTVGVELMVFHTRDNDGLKEFQKEYYQEIETIRLNKKSSDEMLREIETLRKQIDELQNREQKRKTKRK